MRCGGYDPDRVSGRGEYRNSVDFLLRPSDPLNMSQLGVASKHVLTQNLEEYSIL